MTEIFDGDGAVGHELFVTRRDPLCQSSETGTTSIPTRKGRRKDPLRLKVCV